VGKLGNAPEVSPPEACEYRAGGTAPMRGDLMAYKSMKPLPGQLLLFAMCPRCQRHLMLVGKKGKCLQAICAQCGSSPEVAAPEEP
jgi:hypothetical protein